MPLIFIASLATGHDVTRMLAVAETVLVESRLLKLGLAGRDA